MRKIFLLTLLTLFSCKKEEKISAIKADKSKDSIQQSTVKDSIRDFPEAYGFLEKLVKEDIDGQKYDNLQIKKIPFEVHYRNDGDPYSVSFAIMEKSDFNNDGVVDYIVSRNSEGMLGGNANTNGSITYYIMKDKVNKKEEHTIHAYAPFSYNTVEKVQFKNNKLTVDISQNYRVYDGQDLKSAKVSFVYKNNNLYEESYLTDCKLAQLKSKTIFKPNPNVTTRKRTIDGHNYTEVISESYTRNDTLITAEVTGCDNLLLTFETYHTAEDAQMSDEAFKKQKALEFLNFLSKNTLFSKEIKVVMNYFAEHPLTNEYIEIVKGYKFRVLIDQNEEEENELRILVNIDKINNPNQIENWEITTRKK